MALSDELAQRRLAQFEARHGARLVEFAAAASLPVVLDPRLVHLLRINFFADGDAPLPWTAETDLLFSPLCTDLDDGLFEIEPTIRAALLGRLQRDGGPVRIREIASLLWAYLHHRPAPWAHEPGLERAQELTALQVLDPRACAVWLQRAEAAVDRDVRAERPWFVAIQRKLQPWRDLLERRDLAAALRARLEAIARECAALRSLDLLDDVRPPLKQEVDNARLALEQLEPFARQAQAVSDDALLLRAADVDDLDEPLAQARFVLLYSALLRLPFETLVKKAREEGWGKRRFSEVVLSGEDGLAHRWLAARLYEERDGSGDSAVFVVRYSTAERRGGLLRRLRGLSRQQISLQLDGFDPGAVERWLGLVFQEAGRALPQFTWNTNSSQEQILFKLAGWLGLDAELLSQRLARVPIKLEKVAAPPAVPKRSDQRDAAATDGRNMVAVIGIDRYKDMAQLSNSVSSARTIAGLFRTLGFELHSQLLDMEATRSAMHRLIAVELESLGPRDSLVLVYSGHGMTRIARPGGEETRTSYLMPSDAIRDEAASWIALDDWLLAVARLPARHILVILDCCHSGVSLPPVTRWRSVPFDTEGLETLHERRSRRVITAGLGDQTILDSGPVPGCSLFAGCLVEALTPRLNETGRSFVTGSELALYVSRRVASYPYSMQTPDVGVLEFDERGDMVIPLDKVSGETAP